ncbi:MAG: hypothetical protein ABR600_02935 [Actinomycetota bacterium]
MTPPRIGGPSDTSAPRGRRRWPWLLLATFITILAGFGAWAGLFLKNYQPLSANGAGSSGPVVVGEHRLTGHLIYDRGREVRYSFVLRNTGPFPVTILRVGQPGYPECCGVSLSIRETEVRVDDVTLPLGTSDANTVHFRPFALSREVHHGLGREIVVVSRFGRHCPGRDELFSYDSIPITWRIFGITRHTTLPLPFEVAVRNPEGCSRFTS